MKSFFAMLLGGALLASQSLAVARAEEQPVKPEACSFNANTDAGNGGAHLKVCDTHTEAGVSGDVEGVSMKYPLGKGKAALPQAGRDIEKGAHWLGDRTGIHFH
jgi:hypothetical protein